MAKVFTIPASSEKGKKHNGDARRPDSGATAVYTIPALPDPARKRRDRKSDPRFVDGQKTLVNAMNYLVKSDKDAHRSAIEWLSEHVRTRFRMSDRPLS